ncbi:MAG: ATP-binding protein, partial [Deltaproteobacteria bacterium]|nr:ATP-binding protein [Deltaproteobacteria bacterium]
ICYPIKDNKGEATSMAECYRDMTEVVKIREELYESERSRVMESFAAGVAHEVRNPLAVIQSNAQLCLDQVGEKDNDLKEGLEAIIKSVQTANRVIKGLMNFARPQEVEFERQSVGPILKEGLDLIKGRARKQSVGLKIIILSRPPKIIVDKKRFLQAYLNFLLNSLDAMPKGGKIEVSVKNNRKEKKMEILIKDTGEGISEEIIPRVFQPFYSTKKEGLGLGLPIAEGIIRSHGGEVVFKSCRGKGSEVRIELPV